MSYEPTIESRGRNPAAPPRRKPVPTAGPSLSRPPARTAQPTNVTIGPANIRLPARYRVVRELGRGGMGVVLLAEDTEFARLVAIKLILPGRATAEGIARFVREAKVTGQLEHPSIMPVHELLQLEDGTWAMVMKYVEGESLRDRLAAHAKGKPFPLHDKLEIMRRVCDAVGYMHSRGFIHRDIKPDNILVGKHGEVVVADLGIARRVDDADAEQQPEASALDLRDLHAQPQRTLDGKILGTPAYMSPEQANGRISELGPEADVFAIGAVLYALLTQATPYTGRDALTVLRAAQQGEFLAPSRRIATSKRPLPAISTDLESVVLKAMEYDAGHRYANALQMGDDLARVAANDLISARRYGVLARAGKWVQRNPGHASAAAALVFCGMMVGIIGALAQNGIAAADAAKARETAARAVAEQQAERAKVQAALREGQVERLSAEMGVEVTRANLEALDQFITQGQRDLEAGGDGFAVSITNQDIEAILGDVGRARRAENAAGKQVLSGIDFYAIGQLYAYGLLQYRRALHCYDEAVKRDPQLDAEANLHSQRAIAMMGLRTPPSEVLPCLLRAVDLFQRRSLQVPRAVRANLAATLHDLGRFDEANTHYRAALAGCPPGDLRDRLLSASRNAEERRQR